MCRCEAKGLDDSVDLEEAVVVRELGDVAEDGGLRGSSGSGRADCNRTAWLHRDVDEPVEAVGASGCLEERGDGAAVDLQRFQLGYVEVLQEDVVSQHVGQHLRGVGRVRCYVGVQESVLGKQDRERGPGAYLRYDPCIGEQAVEPRVRRILRQHVRHVNLRVCDSQRAQKKEPEKGRSKHPHHVSIVTVLSENAMHVL